MRKRTGTALIAGAAALALSAGAASASGPDHDGQAGGSEARTRALLTALESKDLNSVAGLTHPQATLVNPLSLSGAQEDATRLTGKEQILGFVQSVFTTMGRIDFTDVRVSVTDDGRTSFVQANGDFTTADGRPYRNVYAYRYDWSGGQAVNIEEYANPLTYCQAFNPPGC